MSSISIMYLFLPWDCHNIDYPLLLTRKHCRADGWLWFSHNATIISLLWQYFHTASIYCLLHRGLGCDGVMWLTRGLHGSGQIGCASPGLTTYSWPSIFRTNTDWASSGKWKLITILYSKHSDPPILSHVPVIGYNINNSYNNNNWKLQSNAHLNCKSSIYTIYRGCL